MHFSPETRFEPRSTSGSRRGLHSPIRCGTTRRHLEAHGDAFRALLDNYPDDTINTGMTIDYWQAPADDPTYRYAFGDKVKPDDIPSFAYPVINDWSELDRFLAEFPTAERPDAANAVRSGPASPSRPLYPGELGALFPSAAGVHPRHPAADVRLL